MSSPIRRCSLKGKAIATASDSDSNSSPLVRGPRAITLGRMDNPRPTSEDLAELNDNERSLVQFSLALEEREASGQVPVDDVPQETELRSVHVVNPSADAGLVDKDKTSAEKEINFALADLLPMRRTGTDFEFNEEIYPEQERNACVYESWFNNFSLWWPLPEFLTTYCSRRKIALGQYTENGIRILVTLTVLAAELGIKMSVRLFEEITTPSITAKTRFFYRKMVPKYNVITEKPSKVNFWNRDYFYVKINDASFEDPSVILNGYFNANIVIFSCLLFQTDRLEASARPRRQRMGKLNLAALPSYADSIGNTPFHSQEESPKGNRYAKRRRAPRADERAPNVSPHRSPHTENLAECLGDEVRNQEPSPERNPAPESADEVEVIPTADEPTGEYPEQIGNLETEKNEAVERAEFERSRNELISKELEELKAQKEGLDTRCQNLEQEKSEVELSNAGVQEGEPIHRGAVFDPIQTGPVFSSQGNPRRLGEDSGPGSSYVLQKARADEVQYFEELQGMEVIYASEINLLPIGLDEHGSNMEIFSPPDIEDLST
ncbi:hypothetical protein N665_0070s0035 [Sinapis alba]|nr:hypothetical protein N665_0070s0035 [Sinapis alba]